MCNRKVIQQGIEQRNMSKRIFLRGIFFTVYSLAFFAVCFTSFSCKGCKEISGEEQDMKFTVDMKILGEKVVDSALAYSIYIPRNFVSVGDSVLQLIKNNSDQAQTDLSVDFRSVLFALFADTSIKSFVSIVELKNVPSTFDSVSHMYLQRIKMQVDTTKLMTSTFSLKNAKVMQFLIQKGEDLPDPKVNFKLLFWLPNRKAIQIDYVISRQHYNESTAKAIESSIGSFNSFYQ